MSQGVEKQQLKKTMNAFQGMMYVIGLVIGSGVFLKPSVVLTNMGSTGAALLVWVFGGLITIAAALSIAELAAYIPKIGGLYTYLVELYGETIGFLFGWVSALVNAPGTCGAVSIACATFATFFVPMDGTQQKIFAISLGILFVMGVYVAFNAAIFNVLPGPVAAGSEKIGVTLLGLLVYYYCKKKKTLPSAK